MVSQSHGDRFVSLKDRVGVVGPRNDPQTPSIHGLIFLMAYEMGGTIHTYHGNPKNHLFFRGYNPYIWGVKNLHSSWFWGPKVLTKLGMILQSSKNCGHRGGEVCEFFFVGRYGDI